MGEQIRGCWKQYHNALADKGANDEVRVAVSVDGKVALLRLRDFYLSSATGANLIDFG